MHLLAMAVAHRPKKTNVRSFIVGKLTSQRVRALPASRWAAFCIGAFVMHTTTKQIKGG